MISRSEFTSVATSAISDSVESFRLRAQTDDGRTVSTLPTYQIPAEAMFMPFNNAKASGRELQDELSRRINSDRARGIDPGIVDEESLRLALTRLNLGVDCSNFVVRTLDSLHGAIDKDYADHVFYTGGELQQLHETKPESWSARDADGSPREFTPEEQAMLDSDLVAASWIVAVLGKDLPYIINARRIADTAVNRELDREEVSTGDLVSFAKPDSEQVSHVGIVDKATVSKIGIQTIHFWHSWSTRRFADNGLKPDSVRIYPKSGRHEWSDSGLGDTSRYSKHTFVRPRAFEQVAEASSSSAA